MDPMEEMTLFLENLQKKTWGSKDIFQYILNFCSRSEIKGSQVIISNFPTFPLLVEIVEEIKYNLNLSTYIDAAGDVITVNERKVRDLILTQIDDLFSTVAQGYFSTDSQTYLKNIIDLMRIINEIITTLTERTLINIEHSIAEVDDPQSEFEILFGLHLKDILIKMDGKVLSLTFSTYNYEKLEYDFNINFEKFIKDKKYLDSFLSEYNLHYEIEKRARNIKSDL